MKLFIAKTKYPEWLKPNEVIAWYCIPTEEYLHALVTSKWEGSIGYTKDSRIAGIMFIQGQLQSKHKFKVVSMR